MEGLYFIAYSLVLMIVYAIFDEAAEAAKSRFVKPKQKQPTREQQIEFLLNQLKEL